MEATGSYVVELPAELQRHEPHRNPVSIYVHAPLGAPTGALDDVVLVLPFVDRRGSREAYLAWFAQHWGKPSGDDRRFVYPSPGVVVQDAGLGALEIRLARP